MDNGAAATPNRFSRPLCSAALFVALAAVTAEGFTVWHRDEDEMRGPATTPAASSRAPLKPTNGPPPAMHEHAGPVPIRTGALQRGIGSSLSGDALARAWVRAFLTRDNRNDDGWIGSVAALSTSDVVDELRAAGPDAVGLERLSSWRVERVDRVGDNDTTLDTPTRQVLAYAATVTDGVETVQKPFVLDAYLYPDGTWRVGDVEQPYSSEG